MTRRPAVCVLTAAIASMAAVACRPVPQRVTTSDGRCSVMMPDPPKYREGTAVITGLALKEQSWGVVPDDLSAITRPTDVTAYVLRRATAPVGTAVVGTRMLDEAGRRFAQALENQGYQPPAVRTVTMGRDTAVDVRASMRGEPPIVAARFVAVPDGYCEFSIFGARSEADVSAYFQSVQITP